MEERHQWLHGFAVSSDWVSGWSSRSRQFAYNDRLVTGIRLSMECPVSLSCLISSSVFNLHILCAWFGGSLLFFFFGSCLPSYVNFEYLCFINSTFYVFCGVWRKSDVSHVHYFGSSKRLRRKRWIGSYSSDTLIAVRSISCIGSLYTKINIFFEFDVRLVLPFHDF